GARTNNSRRMDGPMTRNDLLTRAQVIAGQREQRARATVGIYWVRDRAGRRYAVVTSQTEPGRTYCVEGAGCTRQSWAHYGRCRHHDAVVLRLAEGDRCPATVSRPVALEVARDGTPTDVERAGGGRVARRHRHPAGAG